VSSSEYEYHQFHMAIFKRNNEPPYFCFFCGNVVVSLNIHHVNGDHSDNRPENLAAVHRGCHTSFHKTGTVLSPETRRKIGESMKGKPWSPARRAAHEARIERIKNGKK
jgi:5-methylcytosine-specific restriction endonuclease McrA